MNKQKINITMDQDRYNSIEALATLRGLKIEELIDETMGSLLASVNTSISEISENLYRRFTI
jgi:hypothetical protein